MAAIDDDPIFGTIKRAIEGSHASDMKILDLLDGVADRLVGQAAEILELREGLAALSNRIEAVTRESVRVLG